MIEETLASCFPVCGPPADKSAVADDCGRVRFVAADERANWTSIR
jgi:hypothetical protein